MFWRWLFGKKQSLPGKLTAENSMPQGWDVGRVLTVKPRVRVYVVDGKQQWYVEDAHTGKRLLFEGTEVSQWQMFGEVHCPCLALGFKGVEILEG